MTIIWRQCLFIVLIAGLVSCQPSSDAKFTKLTLTSKAPGEVVATVNDRPISKSAVVNRLKLEPESSLEEVLDQHQPLIN